MASVPRESPSSERSELVQGVAITLLHATRPMLAIEIAKTLALQSVDCAKRKTAINSVLSKTGLFVCRENGLPYIFTSLPNTYTTTHRSAPAWTLAGTSLAAANTLLHIPLTAPAASDLDATVMGERIDPASWQPIRFAAPHVLSSTSTAATLPGTSLTPITRSAGAPSPSILDVVGSDNKKDDHDKTPSPPAHFVLLPKKESTSVTDARTVASQPVTSIMMTPLLPPTPLPSSVPSSTTKTTKTMTIVAIDLGNVHDVLKRLLSNETIMRDDSVMIYLFADRQYNGAIEEKIAEERKGKIWFLRSDTDLKNGADVFLMLTVSKLLASTTLGTRVALVSKDAIMATCAHFYRSMYGAKCWSGSAWSELHSFLAMR